MRREEVERRMDASRAKWERDIEQVFRAELTGILPRHRVRLHDEMGMVQLCVIPVSGKARETNVRWITDRNPRAKAVLEPFISFLNWYLDRADDGRISCDGLLIDPQA